MSDKKSGDKEIVVAQKKYQSTNLTLAQMGSIANHLGNSGMFPDVQTGEKAFVKIVAGQEFGIAPFAAMTGIHIIQGKLSLGANLMASKVKESPKYDYKVVKHDEKECEIEFYEVHPDGKKEKIGTSGFTIDDAKTAGLVKSGGQWEKHPRNMVFARAMSNGVKWYCPDIFGGSSVYTPDELRDGDSIEIIEGSSLDDLNGEETIKKDVEPELETESQPEPEEGEITEDKAEDLPEVSTEPVGEVLAGVRLKAKIFAQLRDFGFEGEIAKQIIYKATGIESVSKELSVRKAENLINLLENTTKEKLDQFVTKHGIDQIVAEKTAEELGGELLPDEPEEKEEEENGGN